MKFLQLGVSQKSVPWSVNRLGVFKSVFPIQDFGNRASLHFASYTLDASTSRSARERGMALRQDPR